MLKQTPFLRPLVCFITGILLENHTSASTMLWIFLAFSGALFWMSRHFIALSKKVETSAWNGLAVCFSIISFGGIHASFQKSQEPIFNTMSQQHMLLHLQYDKRTYHNHDRYRARLYIEVNQHWKYRGEILCFLNENNRKRTRTGDVLMVRGDLETLPGPSYPGGFDMKKWGASNEIVGQVRISRNEQMMRLGHHDNAIRKTLEKIQSNTTGILQKRIHNPKNAGLAEAMLIGYKDDLDKHLLDAYTNTGVVHIIAISGLHLGLIFMLLDGLLLLLTGKERSVKLGPYVTLPILWGFSILTGSSASVVRSAVMFSFLIVGTHLKRKNRSMNALLGSAFIMIVYDVQVLSDLGFQLSYAAVGSILIFHRPIREAVTCIHPVIKGLWDMISLTLAAQVLTTPLVIFHFHRFPLLFLFANLVAVPLSSLILMMEIALVFTNPIDSISTRLGKLTDSLIGWMNAFIFQLDQIQWGSVKGISLSGMMIVVLCLCFITIIVFALRPTKSILLSLLLLLIITAALNIIDEYQVRQNRRLIIMDIPRSTCIVHQHGRKGMLLLGGALTSQPQKINQMMEQTGVALGIREWNMRKMPDTPLLISISTLSDPNILEKHSLKVTVLHDMPVKDITPLFLKHEGKSQTFIADASNSLWKSREWEKQAQRLHLRFLSNAYKGYVERRCACPNFK